jgi:alkyl hydroperoxide reductase subunit AhpC
MLKFQNFLVLFVASSLAACSVKPKKPIDTRSLEKSPQPQVPGSAVRDEEDAADFEESWVVLDPELVLSFYNNPVDNDERPAHSPRGPVFDAGPLSRAALVGESYSRSKFDDACDSLEASQYVGQGLGQLHAYWVLEAERSFKTALLLEPTCAMAYWGLSVSNLIFGAGNENRAAQFAWIGAHLAKQNPRPKTDPWLNALSKRFDKSITPVRNRIHEFVKALGDIVKAEPNNIEAKAFFIEFAWESGLFDELGLTEESVNKLIDDVLAISPLHPVHHYRIHLFESDTVTGSQRAKASADLLHQTQSAIPHMWHMSSHTYRGLRANLEASNATEASARRDNAVLVQKNPSSNQTFQVMPFEVHNYLHHFDYFTKARLAAGQPREFLLAYQALSRLPRPLFTAGPVSNESLKDQSMSGMHLGGADFLGLGYTGAWVGSLRRMLSIHGLWTDARVLLQSGQLLDRALDDTANVATRVERAYTRALILSLGEPRQSAGEDLVQLAILKDDEVTKELAPLYIDILKALNAALDASPADRAARFKDFSMTGPNGALRLQLAYRLGLAKELKDTSRLALDSLDLSDEWTFSFRPVATFTAWRAVALFMNDQSELAESLIEANKKDLMMADFSVLPFSALPANVIAKLSGEALTDATVIAKAATIEQLGPMFWQPLVKRPGQVVGVDAHSGDRVRVGDPRAGYRAQLFVFSLGGGCPFCRKQLALLPELKDALDAAGVEVTIVSSDDKEKAEGFKVDFSQAGYPFDFVANDDLRTFKSWGAFSEFEDRAQHGIFLVNKDGRVLWQHLGAQAVEDADTWNDMIKEFSRLLDRWSN